MARIENHRVKRAWQAREIRRGVTFTRELWKYGHAELQLAWTPLAHRAYVVSDDRRAKRDLRRKLEKGRR